MTTVVGNHVFADGVELDTVAIGAGTKIHCLADGNLTLLNDAEDDFGLLLFGGAAGCPALKKDGANLQVVLGDEADFTSLVAHSFIPTNSSGTTPGFPVSSDDLDTGIGSAGADQLSLIAGGVELMNLTQNDAALDEITTNARWNMITPSTSVPLLIRGSGNGARIQIENSIATVYGYMGSMAGMFTGGPSGVSLGYRSEGQFVVGTNGNNIRMWIDNDGRVAIGNTTPDSSAQLDLQHTDGALLLPRLTTTQRDALTAKNSMVIYNTTTEKFQGYENGSWVDLV